MAWIDRICINHDAHAERCHQGNRMSGIYETAQSTTVWSGVMKPMETFLPKEAE